MTSAEADRAEALARLQTQALARPGDPVVRARLALALLAVSAEADAGTSTTAAEALERAIALTRTCLEHGIRAPAYEAADILYKGAPASAEVALLMADATLAHDGGDNVEGARRLLEAVVAEHPDAIGARVRAAALALGLGEAEAARRWVEPVASASAQTSALYVQSLLALGMLDEAIAEAKHGIERAPDASFLHQLLGVAELTRGDVAAATDALSEGLRLAPEDPVAYYNLALAFEASGSKQAALGVADAGLELAPGDPRLVALKGRLSG